MTRGHSAERFEHRLRHVANVRWSVLVVAICLAVALGMATSYVLLVHSGAAGPKQTDFVPYYAAAKLVLEGHVNVLYSLPTIGHVEATLVYPLQVSHGGMPYLYPPYFALLLSPVAALPYSIAFLLWLSINVTLLVLSIHLLQQYLGLTGAAAAVLWSAAVTFFPVLVALAQGQTSILLLALFLLAFLAARSERHVAAGIALSLALIKPPYVIPMLIMVLAARRWRILLSFGVSSGILVAVPYLITGPAVFPDYVRSMMAASGWQQQVGGFAPQWNQSLAGFVQMLLPGASASVVTACLAGSALGILAWRSARVPSIEIPFAFGVVAALLLSPHVLVHDLSILILPVCIAFRHRQRAARFLGLALTGGYLAAFMGLGLVGLIHIQISMVCMIYLGYWLIAFVPSHSHASQQSRLVDTSCAPPLPIS